MELRLAELLDQARLIYADLSVSGTTRRLVAHVQDLSPRQQDEIVERRGRPPTAPSTPAASPQEPPQASPAVKAFNPQTSSCATTMSTP